MAEEIVVSIEATVDFESTNSETEECLELVPGVNETMSGLFIYSTLDENGDPVQDLSEDQNRFHTMYDTPPTSMLWEFGELWFTDGPDDLESGIYLDYVDSRVNEGDDMYAIAGSVSLTNSDCLPAPPA